MPDESNVAYGTDGLRHGAQALTSAQEVTLAATARLQGARLAPGIFGRTAGVGAFTGAVGAARAAQARGFRAGVGAVRRPGPRVGHGRRDG